MESRKTQEAKKQEQDDLCLAKRKQKKELEVQIEQMAIQGNRQRFAAANWNEADLPDNRILLSYHSSEQKNTDREGITK